MLNLIKTKGFIKYAKNSAWLILERVLRIFSGILIGVWVARYLGPENFGLMSFVVAIIAILGGLSKLGLDGIIVREIVNNPKNKNIILGTTFWLKFLSASVVITLLCVLLPFLNSNHQINFLLIILSIGLLFQSFEVIEFYLQAKVLAKFISICKIIQLSISAILKITLIVFNAELQLFVLVIAFDYFTLALAYYLSYKLLNKSPFYRFFDISSAKNLLKDSWPLILSSIVILIYMRIDQIMIKAFMSDYEVGIYSAAVKLSEAIYFIPVIITASLFPAILNARNKSYKEYYERLQSLYSFMIWLAILISIPLTLTADTIVNILFGDEYAMSSSVLKYHIWSSVFIFLGISFQKYLLAENLTKLSMYRTVMGVISNIALNYYMIPIYGVMGAAYSTLISQFIANVGYDFFNINLRHQLKMKAKALLMPWACYKMSFK